MLMPLYLTPDADTKEDLFARQTRASNLDPRFILQLQQVVEKTPSPEEVLGYIYGVLHSTTYRVRYAEFLKKDFPRIPLPNSPETFGNVSRLGWEMVQAHLKRKLPHLSLGAFAGTGASLVEDEKKYPLYVQETQRLHVNPDAWFERVPPTVVSHKIGGYTVLDRYLKSRRGRSLTYEEISHVTEVINILTFTEQQVQAIESVWICP